MNLAAKEIMAFVPSGPDYRRTLQFYQDPGFTADWVSDEMLPRDYPWGKREIHLIGPDGVLLHIAVRLPEPGK